MTVCGLPSVLTVTDEVLQVGFLRKDTVDDWVVGCVYTMCSGATNAWAWKGSVNRDVSVEQSIAIVKAFLGPVPAYMCFIFEPLWALLFLDTSGVNDIEYIVVSLLHASHPRPTFPGLVQAHSNQR